MDGFPRSMQLLDLTDIVRIIGAVGGVRRRRPPIDDGTILDGRIISGAHPRDVPPRRVVDRGDRFV